MKRIRHRLGACLVALAMVAAVPAAAQAPSESHLRAAWQAVRAVGADFMFNQALLDIADRLTIQMKDERPDLSNQIDTIVYDVALELVPRRVELNDEVSALWAATFTEEELNQITAFYSSEVGQKLNQNFQQLQQETLQILNSWYQATAEEVRERSILRLQQQGIEF